jgi:Uma2 family endonuclease
LENGDRLTRAEFERRYEAMPHIKKAELIEGIVHMPSPVHFESHAEKHGQIITWLGTYYAATPGVQLGDNATVRLDLDSEVQPDALLRLEERLGGASCISDDDYVEGPPELIVEIAGSSASYDLHNKLRVYHRNGVREYVVWRVYDQALDWFHLEGGEYHLLEAEEDHVIYSRVFPGLHLAAGALLSGDLAVVLAVLQQGMQSEEYTAFVERLRQRARRD